MSGFYATVYIHYVKLYVEHTTKHFSCSNTKQLTLMMSKMKYVIKTTPMSKHISIYNQYFMYKLNESLIINIIFLYLFHMIYNFTQQIYVLVPTFTTKCTQHKFIQKIKDAR